MGMLKTFLGLSAFVKHNIFGRYLSLDQHCSGNKLWGKYEKVSLSIINNFYRADLTGRRIKIQKAKNRSDKTRIIGDRRSKRIPAFYV
jgi:hypothetical protein